MNQLIHICLWIILIYFVALHGLYFLLVCVGALQVDTYKKKITFAEFHRIAKSHLTMPVSVIIPAYNEAAIIINTVENALHLNYPTHEVIVVDDGSTDQTLDVLTVHFGLLRVDKHGPKHLATEEVLGVYESPQHPNLIVVTKSNGHRADAINAGVTFSKYPLLCIIDADCVMESDALLHLARPFLYDAGLVAAAGVVRPSNGLEIKDGRIVKRGYPKTLLGLNQEIEYARSFQWMRIGLNKLHSMLCISGALILVKKSTFEQLGGSSAGAITDDIEFTIRLSRKVYDRRNEERQSLIFAPDAVCYTEVPETWGLYASQRNRWQRGTIQALLRNWQMIFNPRYGWTGLFGMPFFVFFEAAPAVVEAAAYVLMAVTLLLGMATVWEVVLMLFLAYIIGVYLSLLSVLLSEQSRLRASSWKEFWKLISAIFLDNLGFHQFHLLCRLFGTFQYCLLHRTDLGHPMTRKPTTLKTA